MTIRTLGRVSLAAIVIGYAAGVAALPWLPGPYLDNDAPLVVRLALAFVLPTAALVTGVALDTVVTRATAVAPHAETARAARAIGTFTVLFIVALHGLVLASLLGLSIGPIPAPRLVVVLFGLLLIGIGNVLPRLRPNAVVGIHTRSLIDDRAAWARMHRLAGYFLVLLGALAIGVGLTLSKSLIPLTLTAAAAAGATVNLAAYRRWTRA
jgi:hypothetical protein